MTLEKFKSLPVGTLVKVDETGDIGEIIRTGPMQVDVMFEDKEVWIYVGENSKWDSFIGWLEVEEV